MRFLALCALALGLIAAVPVTYGNSITAGIPTYNAAYYDVNLCTTAAHNDTTGIQAAVNAAESQPGGGIVIIPFSRCWVQSTITINSSNIHIVGLSGGTQAINQNPGTQISWAGSCGTNTGPIFLFKPSGAYSIEGSDLSSVYLDSGANAPGGLGCAAAGLVINSTSYGHWTSIGANAFQTVAVQCTTTHTLTNGLSIQNTFQNLFINNSTNTGIGLQLTSDTANGAFDCNTNTFIDTYVGSKNGIGIDIQYTDHNLFVNVSDFLYSGGSGPSFLFDCGSRYNIVYYLQGTQPTAYGTAQCTGALSASIFNHIDAYDVNGAGGNPIIDAGATLTWADQKGNFYGSGVYAAPSPGATQAPTLPMYGPAGAPQASSAHGLVFTGQSLSSVSCTQVGSSGVYGCSASFTVSGTAVWTAAQTGGCSGYVLSTHAISGGGGYWTSSTNLVFDWTANAADTSATFYGTCGGT